MIAEAKRDNRSAKLHFSVQDMFRLPYANQSFDAVSYTHLVPELTEEEIKRQEQLKRHRIKSRERYQKIKAGEHAVGQPFTLTCKCCGQEFASKRTNTLFCGPNCRAKFYRQEAAESRSRACTCENCGKEFITTRSDVKYCSDDCRYAAQIKRQGARKKALREAKNEKETKTA